MRQKRRGRHHPRRIARILARRRIYGLHGHQGSHPRAYAEVGKLLGPKGIRVNTLYPGFIDTDMTHGATKMESYINSVIGKIPLGRYGNVDDCANAVLYLASDASSFMNGQHLVIDGGELA